MSVCVAFAKNHGEPTADKTLKEKGNVMHKSEGYMTILPHMFYPFLGAWEMHRSKVVTGGVIGVPNV